MPEHDVRLLVSGQRYGGWKSITIRRGMEQVAGTFELGITERWPGQDVPRPIRPGAACRLTIDGQTVITGYVDDVDVRYDSKSHSVTISGRDATGDLVDCSAPSTQFSDRGLAEVAKELCKPFGVGVVVSTDCGGSFQRLKNNEGDSVFETLEAAARVRAVLLLSDGQGNLVLSRVSGERVSTSLVLGENIKSAGARFSHRDRFSEYTVKGQTIGSDEWDGEAAAHPEGKASDSAVSRHRPLTILAEEQSDQATAQERAEWERSVRFGRSRTVDVTVRGWTQAGQLWTPNRLVHLQDSFLGIDADMLISGVTLRLDGGGTLTDLALLPPEAFQRLELPEPGESEGGWS
ncbi:MAG: hypothetical protein KKB70_08435 [Proteobacteria bacterium]|nr:hypothetical protein [Pseudomonadota bacterium]